MFNPASFFDLKFIINLPGDIIETNGTVNPETGDISWKIDFNRKSSMHAVSESWNWFNIGAMTVSVGFLGIIVVAGGGLALLMVWKKNQSQSAPQAGQRSEKPDPPVAAKDLTVDDFLDSLVASSHTEEVLAEIDAENYLQQINQKLLKGRGEFEETSNGLRLTWPNGKEWVEVEVIDAERISINGKRHPATRKALNDGLIAALKTMNKIKGN